MHLATISEVILASYSKFKERSFLPRCYTSHGNPSNTRGGYNIVPEEEEASSVGAEAMAKDIVGDPLQLELQEQANRSFPKPKQAVRCRLRRAILPHLLIIPTAVKEEKQLNIKNGIQAPLLSQCTSIWQVLLPKGEAGTDSRCIPKGHSEAVGDEHAE